MEEFWLAAFTVIHFDPFKTNLQFWEMEKFLLERCHGS
jgi:hypothetical protein